MANMLPIHPKKVLVIRFSSIGDIVLCSPVFRLIKEQLQSEVHWLTKTNYSFINEHNPYIDKTHLYQKNFSSLTDQLNNENFDLVIDLHKNLRSWRFKQALKKPSLTFDKRNIEKWILVNLHRDWMREPRHLVDRYLNAIAPLGITDDGQGLDYFYGPATKNPVPFKNYIAYGIGGTYRTKKMPADQIVRHFSNLPLPLVLLGGKSETDASEYIQKHLGKHCVNMVNQCDLHTTGRILDDAKFVISHDTATMHMAAAFRKKILSVWGATAPELGMTPYLPKQFKENSVLLEKEDLPCHPCSKLGNAQCPKGHFKCLTDLKDEHVKIKINELLTL